MKNICKVIVVIALFGGIGLARAQAEPFHVSGSYVEAAFDGNIAEGTVSGRAAPGGDAFIGQFSENVYDGGAVLDGTATLDFGNGDTLTFDYLLDFDSTSGRYLGVWIIQGGTGTLDGASGGGEMAAMPNSSQAHQFWLKGDLSRE